MDIYIFEVHTCAAMGRGWSWKDRGNKKDQNSPKIQVNLKVIHTQTHSLYYFIASYKRFSVFSKQMRSDLKLLNGKRSP